VARGAKGSDPERGRDQFGKGACKLLQGVRQALLLPEQTNVKKGKRKSLHCSGIGGGPGRPFREGGTENCCQLQSPASRTGIRFMCGQKSQGRAKKKNGEQIIVAPEG